MKYKRLIIGLIIAIFFISMMIYSFQEFDKNDPNIKKLKLLFGSSDYYNNTEISFRALIYSVNKTNHTLYVSIEEKPYDYPNIEINIENLDIQNLKKGDLIDVIGTLNGKNKMKATKLWLIEPWKENLIYIRSIFAIPFVLFLFLKTWKFNTKSWYFERRKGNA